MSNAVEDKSEHLVDENTPLMDALHTDFGPRQRTEQLDRPVRPKKPPTENSEVRVLKPISALII